MAPFQSTKEPRLKTASPLTRDQHSRTAKKSYYIIRASLFHLLKKRKSFTMKIFILNAAKRPGLMLLGKRRKGWNRAAAKKVFRTEALFRRRKARPGKPFSGWKGKKGRRQGRFLRRGERFSCRPKTEGLGKEPFPRRRSQRMPTRSRLGFKVCSPGCHFAGQT